MSIVLHTLSLSEPHANFAADRAAMTRTVMHVRLGIRTAWLLAACSLALAQSAAYPSALDALQHNETQKEAATWESVDLQKAQQNLGGTSRSGLEDLLHWAIGNDERLHARCGRLLLLLLPE